MTTINNELATLTTLDELSGFYETLCVKHDLTADAEEELLRDDLSEAARADLSAFVLRWEEVEALCE